jgi:hypothetical protein
LIQIQAFVNWFNDWLRRENFNPLFAGIIGSVASQINMPNDCDILIVVEDSFDNEYWQIIQRKKKKLINCGKKIFHIPLHLTILSRREIREQSSFVATILRKPIIVIIGDLNELLTET